MKLHQCCICGKIDQWPANSWRSYGSLLLQDERPDLIARLCSDECQREFEARMKRGEIIPANAKANGMRLKITEPKGYSPHPPQEELLKIYNQRIAEDQTKA